MYKKAINDLVRLSNSNSVDSAVKETAELIKNVSGAKTVSLFFIDKTKRFLTRINNGSWNIPAPTIQKGLSLTLNSAENKRNVCVYAAILGKQIWISDAYSYSGYDLSDIYQQDVVLGEKTRNILVEPIRKSGNEIIGVVQLTDVDVSDENVALFTDAVCIAGNIIENLRKIETAEMSLDEIYVFKKELEKENQLLKEKMNNSKHNYEEIIGSSESISRVLKLVDKAIESEITVLIKGETGTGKELVAKAIHKNGRRRNREFVVQNCAALPENLLESELFGYKKGAFTGAVRDKIGLFELANGGTLFLDEIGDIPLSLQAKLLRVIQEKEIRPLGSIATARVDVRIVTASHKDLFEMVKQGLFREDLYYRLSVFPIELPPLRDRKEDIPEIATFFVESLQKLHGKKIAGINRKAFYHLMQYEYPGNVRELKNIVERLIVLCDDNGLITENDLPVEVLPKERKTIKEMADGLKEIVADYEARVIKDALVNCRWNQTSTAKTLKIGRRTLIEKINRYGIRQQRHQNTM